MADGFHGLLAPWIGGAGNDPTAAPVGYRGMFASWMGGAGSLGGATPVGFIGLLAPWMGGGGYGPASDAIAPDWIVMARRRGKR